MSFRDAHAHSQTPNAGPFPARGPRRNAVLLVGLGAPDGPDVPSVRRFLTEYLSDPAVAPAPLPRGPRWLHRALGRWRARAQAPRTAALYRQVWRDRGAPLTTIIGEQAAALADVMPEGWQVFAAMRYGRPAIARALRRIAAEHIDELVVVPMYPQFSHATTGAAVEEVYRVLRHVGHEINVATCPTWYDDVGYVNAQARRIAEYVTEHDLDWRNTHLVFTAHSPPAARDDLDDPFGAEVRRTVELVTQRLGWPQERTSVSFQCGLGPIAWLGPDVQGRLAELAHSGEKTVLVCPITFTADCVGTLGGTYRRIFEAHGGRVHLCPALNVYPAFITALKNLVLHGPRSVDADRATGKPLLAPRPTTPTTPADDDLGALVMVGASVAGPVPVAGTGPPVRYSDPGMFERVKKSRRGLREFLRWTREHARTHEAFVWNTCQRIEFYGWLESPADVADRECLIARIRHQLYGAEPEGLEVNVLFGVEAWHHLMRTACGLNSALPGDMDVVAQLETAARIAERDGTGGPRSCRLVEQAVTLSRDIRERTPWGRFSRGFCSAALARVRDVDQIPLDVSEHVVIGGSTTSRSILSALADQFEVDRRRLTIVYRDHHGQMKLLRTAIGNGKRLRVHAYTEPGVLRAIARADCVYFGIDHPAPVLDLAALRGVRDFTARPLTVVDFNHFGSVAPGDRVPGVKVWTAKDLDAAVATYAEVVSGQELFARAVREAEEQIVSRLPSAGARAPSMERT